MRRTAAWGGFLLSLTLGVYWTRDTWGVYRETASRAHAAELRASEAEKRRVELATEEAALRSASGMEARARRAGWRRPNEIKADAHVMTIPADTLSQPQ